MNSDKELDEVMGHIEEQFRDWGIEEWSPKYIKQRLNALIEKKVREARQKPYVPELNAETYELLKSLYSRYGDQTYYSYKDLSRVTGISVERLKELLPIFKKLGVIQTFKGLQTEDGEVYGSGFGIPHGVAELVAELAISRYEAQLQDNKPYDEWKNNNFPDKPQEKL